MEQVDVLRKGGWGGGHFHVGRPFRHAFRVPPMTRLALWNGNTTLIRYQNNYRSTPKTMRILCKTYRTSSVTHPNVALDVKRRRPGEPERFHVSEYLRLEHLTLAPRSSETADQFVVDRATRNERKIKNKPIGSVDALKHAKTQIGMDDYYRSRPHVVATR